MLPEIIIRTRALKLKATHPTIYISLQLFSTTTSFTVSLPTKQIILLFTDGSFEGAGYESSRLAKTIYDYIVKYDIVRSGDCRIQQSHLPSTTDSLKPKDPNSHNTGTLEQGRATRASLYGSARWGFGGSARWWFGGQRQMGVWGQRQMGVWGAVPDGGLGAVSDGGLGAAPDGGLGAVPDGGLGGSARWGFGGSARWGLGAVPYGGLGAAPDGGLGAVPDGGLGGSAPDNRTTCTAIYFYTGTHSHQDQIQRLSDYRWGIGV